MKTLVLLCAIISSFTLQAQKLAIADVPQPVLAAFKKSNPTIANPEWYKTDKKFQVRFKANQGEKMLTYTDSGTLVVHDYRVAIATLPSNVKVHLDKFYAGKTVDKVLKMTDKNGTVTYLVGITGADLFFDSKGYYLKSVKR